MGHMVGCKQTIKSFKIQKLEHVPEKDWITVRNTHEAIVDEETFWHVQDLLSIKRPANVRTKENIFVGKLRCSDCGKHLAFQNVQGRHKTGSFICNRYRRDTKFCTAHYIRYDALHGLVLNDIRKKADLARCFKGDFAEYLQQLADNKSDVQESNYRREFDRSKARFDEVEQIVKRLFEQNALGVIPDDRFTAFLGEYTDEQSDLQAKIDKLQTQLDKQKPNAEGAELFFGMIEKYTDVEELTTKVITDLIDHIVIYEHTGDAKNWRQRVDIFYRFAGLTQIQT
jgi:uncharacterized membrane-anchored protein YhcB (DUF1043 family)